MTTHTHPSPWQSTSYPWQYAWRLSYRKGHLGFEHLISTLYLVLCQSYSAWVLGNIVMVSCKGGYMVCLSFHPCAFRCFGQLSSTSFCCFFCFSEDLVLFIFPYDCGVYYLSAVVYYFALAALPCRTPSWEHEYIGCWTSVDYKPGIK